MEFQKQVEKRAVGECIFDCLQHVQINFIFCTAGRCTIFVNDEGYHRNTQCALNQIYMQISIVKPHSWRSVFNTTLCDKVCQRLAICWWFSPSTPVSSTNKTDHHNITEILLKVALNTINPTPVYVYVSHKPRKIQTHSKI